MIDTANGNVGEFVKIFRDIPQHEGFVYHTSFKIMIPRKYTQIQQICEMVFQFFRAFGYYTAFLNFKILAEAV